MKRKALLAHDLVFECGVLHGIHLVQRSADDGDGGVPTTAMALRPWSIALAWATVSIPSAKPLTTIMPRSMIRDRRRVLFCNTRGEMTQQNNGRVRISATPTRPNRVIRRFDALTEMPIFSVPFCLISVQPDA